MTTQIKQSGTHMSVKIIAPIARILNSIHPIQPMKGTKNPPHIQVKVPQSLNTGKKP